MLLFNQTDDNDLYACVSDVSLSSDFISGFCGETEDDHQQTLSLIREVGYNVGFLFAYSMRKVSIGDTATEVLCVPNLLLSNHSFFLSWSLLEDACLPSATGRCGTTGQAAEAGGVHWCFQRGGQEGQHGCRWQHTACAGGGSEYMTGTWCWTVLKKRKHLKYLRKSMGQWWKSPLSSAFDSPSYYRTLPKYSHPLIVFGQ